MTNSMSASLPLSVTPLPHVRRTGQAPLPTEHGQFLIQTYLEEGTQEEHIVLSMGELPGAEPVSVRLHSECATGDLFGSLRCDCGPQLHLAMQRIAAQGRGVLVYLKGHEGRGIGLAQKLAAYQLQDQGLDTVDANRALGQPVDARNYGAAAAILIDLGIHAVRLMSNNPRKLAALQAAGIDVVERSAHELPAQPHNRDYLATKRKRLGHLLDLG